MAITGARRPVRDSADRRIAELAARQHGVFTRAQAFERGVTEGMMNRRLVSGRWDRLYAGVYRVAGVPSSWRQALLAACFALGPRAVVSHRAAAALWRLPGFEPGHIELIVPRRCKRTIRGGSVHRPLILPSVDVTTIDGIPATSAARTLLDIASTAAADVIEEALDDALRRRLVSISRLRWRLDDTARKGRPGVSLMRRLLDARTAELSVPQSVLETRLLRLLKRSDLPMPRLQHRVKDGGRLVAIVDFAYPEQLIAIEALGHRWHGGRTRWRRDLARMNALTALGWQVIHVTWDDLTERPTHVVALIGRALGQPRRRPRRPTAR